MNAITEALQQCCAELKSDARIWVAFSGGLDSSVLLHALVSIIPQFPNRHLTAIHIDHQLQEGSHNWASHCADVCQQLGVEYQLLRVEVASDQGLGPEQAARLARYGALEQLIGEGEFLFTAHHQNDQAETLILQLLRAGGLEGLAAMPVSKVFGKGTHLRPFLDLPRDLLEAYAHQHQLSWIEDPTNQELEYRRNFVRHKLLPMISTVWPGASQLISQSSRYLSSNLSLLNDYLNKDLEQLLLAPDVLSIAELATHSEDKQRHLLRHWYSSLGLSRPGESKLNLIIKEVIQARPDATPELRWQNSLLTRSRELLILLPDWNDYPEQRLQLNYEQRMDTPFWEWELTLPAGIDAGDCRVEYGDYQVSYQQHGISRKLKILYKARGIAKYLRPLIPRLIYREQICLVPGLFASTEFSEACSQFDFKRLNPPVTNHAGPLISVSGTD